MAALRFLVATPPVLYAANDGPAWPPPRRSRSDLDMLRVTLALWVALEAEILILVAHAEGRSLWAFQKGDAQMPTLRAHALAAAEHGMAAAKRAIGIGAASNKVGWRRLIVREALAALDLAGVRAPEKQAAYLGLSRATVCRIRSEISTRRAGRSLKSRV